MGMRFESDRQEEEHSTYDAYEALEGRKAGRKMVYFYVAAGLGVFILVLVFVMLGNASGRQETDNRLRLIEQRLDDMEFRFGNLVQNESVTTDIGALQKADLDLSQRFDTLERKLEGQLNQMRAALTKLEKRRPLVVAPPKPPPAAPKAATPKASPPKSAAPAKTRQHTVQKGETIYKISRKYGMSVEALRKLNGIGEDFTIYPGQKIKVAGKQ